jgi:flavin reductase (DIM6/NTAB) family NADH-FMN oxidoreductase RutF
VGLTPVPSHTVAPPRIQEAPIAFECVLHEKLETPSRYVFIGRIQWLAAREGLIDTEAWRVNLRDYKPVARFGASFYTRTEDRFSLSDKPGEAPVVNTAIDQI